VDATAIAQAVLGRPVANTAMLGALAGAGLIGVDAVVRAIGDAFPGAGGERNVEAAKAAMAAVVTR
jgi:pyruvate ferredoxin oxidoreductase gamma subunit